MSAATITFVQRLLLDLQTEIINMIQEVQAYGAGGIDGNQFLPARVETSFRSAVTSLGAFLSADQTLAPPPVCRPISLHVPY